MLDSSTVQFEFRLELAPVKLVFTECLRDSLFPEKTVARSFTDGAI